MKKILGIFLKGIFVLVPIVLTFFIVFKVYEFTDGLFREWLEYAGFYFPGLGVLVTLAVIFLIGLLASNWITGKVVNWFDKLIIKIPLIGSVYAIIKDTVNSFSSSKKGFSRLVMVNLPNEMKLLGFLTNDEQSIIVPPGYAAVYLMQSMQWAGNLILVPEKLVQPVDVPAEEALKFIASAGLIKVNATNHKVIGD
ncbi:MAG: DUF502 domain-containing protein [Syntrophomonadaceae bacterium]|nr:DUF502 domain-containing protein [Syntrophomonadaceae bacterium]MDD3889543.1 DUF502 domain-containing protein [Syntrophomonadaceae bacterium]MDD4548534.1 DUF502 domain-containing protein [Syntrophomonadaceae bacterium]